MIFHQQLIGETPNSSLSALSYEGTFLCFILEDGFRMQKEYGKTRIPPGRYEIVPRKFGRIFDSMRKRHGHTFVPQLLNVPQFSDILIHPGITVEDTLGCLLPGYEARKGVDVFSLKDSTAAYNNEIYPRLDSTFRAGEKAYVRISRELIFTGA